MEEGPREREKVEGYADEGGCVAANSQADEAESQPATARGWRKMAKEETGDEEARSDEEEARRSGFQGSESGAFTLRTFAFFPAAIIGSLLILILAAARRDGGGYRNLACFRYPCLAAGVAADCPHSAPFNWFFPYHPRPIDGDSFAPRRMALASSKRRSV